MGDFSCAQDSRSILSALSASASFFVFLFALSLLPMSCSCSEQQSGKARTVTDTENITWDTATENQTDVSFDSGDGADSETTGAAGDTGTVNAQDSSSETTSAYTESTDTELGSDVNDSETATSPDTDVDSDSDSLWATKRTGMGIVTGGASLQSTHYQLRVSVGSGLAASGQSENFRLDANVGMRTASQATR